MADADAQPTGVEARIEDQAVESRQRKAGWRGALAHAISSNFRCQSYYSYPGGRVVLRFIGLKDDCDICVAVYRSAVEVAERLVRHYIDGRKAEQGWMTQRLAMRIRTSYLGGFVRGLDQKLRDQVTANQWALVLVMPQPVKEAVDDLHLGKASQSKARYDGDRAAVVAGVRAGQEFDHPVMPHDRRQIVGAQEQEVAQ